MQILFRYNSNPKNKTKKKPPVSATTQQVVADIFNASCNLPDIYRWANMTPAYPFYPAVANNFSINGTYHEVPCINYTVTKAPNCPPSTVLVDGLYCYFACPLQSLTTGQYNSAEIMQAIISWFSWVLLFFCIEHSLISIFRQPPVFLSFPIC